MVSPASSLNELPAVSVRSALASPGEKRYMELTRRLTRVTAGGAAAISALTIVACWGDWRSVEILVLGQVAIVPFNVWVNLRLLKRLGLRNGELLRLCVNLVSTFATSHLTRWPLPAWLWLPFIALAFDQFERRIGYTILFSVCAGMSVLSLFDGVSLILPLSFTVFAIFCAQISKMRVGEISDMLLAGDAHRRELEKAHAAAQAAHEQLTRETEARQLIELELRQAHRLEAVGALAAGLAHEINTPAQFVGDSLRFAREGFKELLELVEVYKSSQTAVLDGTPIGEAAARTAEAEQAFDISFLVAEIPVALDRSLQGMERIASIVRSMKEFAQPDRKEMIAVDLNAAIASTIEIARSEYQGKAQVELRTSELPPVVCHAGEINQVVLNLIVNAAHAISDRGLRENEAGHIVVRTKRDGDTVTVSVSDDGIGISEDIRERIFDPFFTTRSVGEGTGQGLAVARAIVRRHGGTLTFDSRPGNGTTFFMRLPIHGSAGGGS
jgi:signal transduction histidine kinase